ncbi:MAG: prepilin-type N-terminal cleavage/methylation domain-containing protein [Pirellulales bacterium]|nr:prepilin-type N-terminal cleavage/methylation domain-containing protein [Pirellulales bacterium]
MSSALFHKVVNRRKGFSLVELAVVVIIIGVLAAFGVPRMLQAVERSKASEAFGYLSSIRSAQERYQAREGKYATTTDDLDISQSAPKYFDLGEIVIEDGVENAWSMTLTRKAGSSGYGQYLVVFTQEGYDSTNSTIPDDVNPLGSEAAAPVEP